MRRRWWIAAIMLVLVAAPAAWYLGSPLFINRTVSESFAPAGTDRASARFTDADAFHKGTGVARLVAAGSGDELRFEDFRVTNGPDLYVYLAVHPRPRTRAEVDEGFVNLGRLKGNIGLQAYPVPGGTDLARYRSVVIYCRTFHVVFSTATLGAP